MVFRWWTVVLVSVVAWTAGWLLKGPVPQGYHDPWTFRGIAAMQRSMEIVHWVQDFYMDHGDILVSQRPLEPMDETPTFPVDKEDTFFDGVQVRIYRPAGLPQENNPGIIFYHGGGFILGNIMLYDNFALALAHEVKAIVVSVEYRLAPEHPFPAGLDDCVTATKHFLRETSQYGVDSSRVAIGGDSAGGNLAAATALVLRDQKVTPQPKLQVLIYPMTQAINFQSPSRQLNVNDVFLTSDVIVSAWLLYANISINHRHALMKNQHTTPAIKRQFYSTKLNPDIILSKHKDADYIPSRVDFGDAALWEQVREKFTNPYFAPMMVENPGGVPEALMFTVEQDVLRDDGLWYAEHMRAAGVPVTSYHYTAGYHGMMSLVFSQRNHVEARRKIYLALKRKL